MNYGFSANDAIDFMMELGGVELHTSTIGLDAGGVTAAIWQFSRVAIDFPPTDFHLLGFGLHGELSGRQSMPGLAGREDFRVSPGSAFYIPAGRPVIMSASGDAAALYLMLNSELMQRAVREIGPDGHSGIEKFLGFNRRFPPWFPRLAWEVFRETTIPRPAASEIINGAGKLAAVALVRDRNEANNTATVARSPTVFSDDIASQIIEEIEADLRSAPDLPAIAEAHGLGRDVIDQGFQAMTGLNMTDFRQSARVNRAFYMLVYTEHTLTSVAQSVGFSNADALSTTVQADLGVDINAIRAEGVVRP